MIEIDIPGKGIFNIKYLVLDMNGTITLDGNMINGVQERLSEINKLVHISIITADTYDTVEKLKLVLDIEFHKIDKGQEQEQKRSYIHQLGTMNTIAIGNGTNDSAMLKECAIGICVLGPEGTSAEALLSSDIIVADILKALDLVLTPQRITATLRR